MTAALIAAAVLLGYGRLLFAPDALITDFERPLADNATPAVVPRVVGNDLTRLYQPAHRRIAAAIRRDGRIPTWDPTGFGGRPIPANPQSGLWYPPVWLIWALDRPAAWSWVTLAHLVWAGWGASSLARFVGVGPAGASLAGIAFALSPYMTAQVEAGHVPHVWAASWMGWGLAALIAGFEGRSTGWWWLAATLAMAALSGHPQEAYLLTFTVLSGGCVGAIRKPRMLIPLTGTLGVAAALTAIAWMPVLAGLPESRTAEGVPGTASEPYLISGANLLQLIWPLGLGGPFDYRGRGNYAESQIGPGVVVAGLALVALVHEGRRRTLPWLPLIAACWVIAAGRPLGVWEVMRGVVPGFDQIRVPSRTLFLAALAMGVLAGIGIDAAWRIDHLGWARVREPRLESRAAPRNPGRGRRLAVVFALAAVVELIGLTWAVVRVDRPAERPSGEALDAAIVRHRRDPNSRIRAPEHVIDAARIDRLGLETTDVYDWYQLRRSADLYESLYALGSPPRVWTPYDPWGEVFRDRFRKGVLDRMGVELVVVERRLSPAPVPVVEDGDGDVLIHTNPTALPRAYVVPYSWIAPDSGWRVTLAWLDPREYVLLDEDPLPPGRRQAFTAASYRRPANDRVVVEARTEDPGFLVVGDAWAPGWRAWRNGVEVAIRVGNHSQRVIELPDGGNYRVEMRYEAPGLATGLAVSVLGWAVWVFGLGMKLRSKH